MRIELLANGVQSNNLALLQRAHQLAQRELDAFADLREVISGVCDGRFEAVHHGQQMLGEAFDGELVRLRHVFLTTAADVFRLRLGAQEAFLHLGQLGLYFRQRGFGAGRLCLLFASRFRLLRLSLRLARCGLCGLARGFVGGRGILARRILLRVFHVAEIQINKAKKRRQFNGTRPLGVVPIQHAGRASTVQVRVRPPYFKAPVDAFCTSQGPGNLA